MPTASGLAISATDSRRLPTRPATTATVLPRCWMSWPRPGGDLRRSPRSGGLSAAKTHHRPRRSKLYHHLADTSLSSGVAILPRHKIATRELTHEFIFTASEAPRARIRIMFSDAAADRHRRAQQ